MRTAITLILAYINIRPSPLLKQLLCPLWGADSTTATAFSTIRPEYDGAYSDRLQRVQNTPARVVYPASWSASAPDLFQRLHWLPVRQRVRFKLAAVTFNVSAYLHDDLHDYQCHINGHASLGTQFLESGKLCCVQQLINYCEM